MSGRDANLKADSLLFFELQPATGTHLRVSLIVRDGQTQIICKTPGTEHYQAVTAENLERVCQWTRAIRPSELVNKRARIGGAGWNLIVARETSHARQRNSLA